VGQRGIYVLLQDWKVVYVGKTAGHDLGARLRTHLLRDTLVGRWDRFSWYGTRNVKKDGTLGPLAQIKSVTASDAIGTLEALLIAVTEPARNRRKEKIPGAVPVVQDDELAGLPSETVLAELRAGMLDVVARLERIEHGEP
jgi:hypothetical protein